MNIKGSKVAICHFHNGCGGGVLSVIRNLLRYRQHPEIENHVIYTINKEEKPYYEKPGLQGASSEQVFYYSPKWNFYYTCRQLAKLLPDDKAVIVAHDWLELGMVSNLGLQNPVVQILHGDFDYYYDLAKLHSSNIDAFISVSKVIETKLKLILPDNITAINYLRFPVSPASSIVTKDYSCIKCTYFVRDLTEERKQFCLIPIIDNQLLDKNIEIEWHIAGGGMSNEKFQQFWGQNLHPRVYFYGELNTCGIEKILQNCNIMVLPSLSEGFPVAVVEAMKYGLIPLVSKWDGAVSDLVIDGITGYTLENHNPVTYAEQIMKMACDPIKMWQMGTEAKKNAEELFNPNKNAMLYEDMFLTATLNNKIKNSFKAYGSSLDHPLLPNIITKIIRIIKK